MPARRPPLRPTNTKHGLEPDSDAGADQVASLLPAREASGTAWVPDATPMYAWMRESRGWGVMVHGQAFAQVVAESGEAHRRGHQAGSVNWLMAVARRRVGAGRLGLWLMASATPGGRHTWFGRFEVVGKLAHDLHVHEASGEVLTVGKLQGGYVHALAPRRGLVPGIGASMSASLLPPALAPRYAGRVAPGVGVFLTVRPARHRM